MEGVNGRIKSSHHLVPETDYRWIPEYERFWKVFPRVQGVNVVTTIPGNHDIGLGDGINPDKLYRFKSHFAGNSTSKILTVCNFQIILLDTSSLLNTANPEIFEPTFAFLDSISNIPQPYGRLLFSHIPLYRPPDTNCGSLRESSQPIQWGGGYQYQNTLDAELTTRILDTIWPVAAIFSGDDHDYCVIQHTLEGRREQVPECTVKSFSWAMVSLLRRVWLMTGNQTSWISITFDPLATHTNGIS